MNEEARKKALEYGMEAIHKYDDAMKELAEIERQEREALYTYRVIDYAASGEGRNIFLQISRNNSSRDNYEKDWKSLVNYDYYLQGEEELTEREFLDRYTRLIPNMIFHLLREKSLTIWQQHFHFNRY